jgi:hypothetical protein
MKIYEDSNLDVIELIESTIKNNNLKFLTNLAKEGIQNRKGINYNVKDKDIEQFVYDIHVTPHINNVLNYYKITKFDIILAMYNTIIQGGSCK